MATLMVKIQNGFFSDSYGRYLESLSPTHLVGNGWDCTINPDGSLFCECAREYSDGLHSIRYVIQKSGFAKLTLKTPWTFKVLRRGFVTTKGVPFGNGTLGLAGGNVDERYAYYRDSAFQKFLEKFGITAVKHEDPNQTFAGFSNYSGWGTASQIVYSDGKIQTEYEDCPGSLFKQTNLYSGTDYNTVSGAKWAIVETSENYRENHNFSRILYTKVQNIMDLEESLTSVLKAPI